MFLIYYLFVYLIILGSFYFCVSIFLLWSFVILPFSVVIVCFLCLRFCYCSCSFCCWCFYFISFLTGFSFSTFVCFCFCAFLGRVLLMLFYDVHMNVCKNCLCCYKTLFALILYPLTRFETINFILYVFVGFF